MPPIFWTGKLSLPMRLLVNTSNLLAWITGNARDTVAMKQRMKRGYEGQYSNDIKKYDAQGMEHYSKIARELLDGTEVSGKEVVDIGCGTGILSLLALKEGASKVTCGDLSEYMLSQCRNKITAQGYESSQVDFRIVDAEDLPFNDNSFDIAFSSMVLGLVPNQSKVITEMGRVIRPGGVIGIAIQGTEYYAEAVEAAFRIIPKHYVIGYRIEFFPLSEGKLAQMLVQSGLKNVKTRRITWKDSFKTGSELYDFFSATSSAWWYEKLPSDKITEIADNTKKYLERIGITELSQDVILAFGEKPGKN